MRAVVKLAFTLIFIGAPFCLGQDCHTRTVLLNVSDDQLRVVRDGISQSNLAAKIGGKDAPVVGIRRISTAPRVMVLLDTSGSMEPIRIPFRNSNLALEPLVTELIRAVPEGLPLAVGDFDRELRHLTAFSADREFANKALQDAIKQQSRRGLRSSAIGAAVNLALYRFGTIQPGDSVILITDAADNRSKNLKTAIQAIQASGIRVFLVLFEDTVTGPITADEYDGRDRFSDLVVRSGGSMWRVSKNLDAVDSQTQAAMRILLQRMMARITEAWEVSIQTPQTLIEPSKVELRLTGVPKQVKKLRLEYPRMLPACSGTSASSIQP